MTIGAWVYLWLSALFHLYVCFVPVPFYIQTIKEKEEKLREASHLPLQQKEQNTQE